MAKFRKQARAGFDPEFPADLDGWPCSGQESWLNGGGMADARMISVDLVVKEPIGSMMGGMVNVSIDKALDRSMSGSVLDIAWGSIHRLKNIVKDSVGVGLWASARTHIGYPERPTRLNSAQLAIRSMESIQESMDSSISGIAGSPVFDHAEIFIWESLGLTLRESLGGSIRIRMARRVAVP